MADSAGTELAYGQLGQANYDPDEQTWSFQRNHTSRPWLPLGQPKPVAKPSIADPPPALSQGPRSVPSDRHPRQVESLVKQYPEIQPASNLLPPLLRVSEALESATARHDPLKGNLLAIGTIPSQASKHAITVATYPCGPTGGDLRIVEVQAQRRGWDDTKAAWLEVPTIHGEGVTWHGEGVPIQQICFARAIEGSDSSLGVRMPTRTLIFRPILRNHPLRDDDRLDVNLCFQVPVTSTGGLPHADVAFNPLHTRQFGIIDQTGSWSIWELEGRLSTTGRCLHKGSLPENSIATPTLDDGWARITWTAGPGRIAVTTRERLALCDISGEAQADIPEMEVGLQDSRRWIQGLVCVPGHPAFLCVLSSAHITIHQVKPEAMDSLQSKLVANIKHFRDPADTTLLLAMHMVHGRVLVLISSSCDSLITAYELHFDDLEQVQVSTPWPLALPESAPSAKQITSAAGLHIVDVQYGARQQQPLQSVALQIRVRGLRFAAVNVLCNDLSLQQSLYYASPNGGQCEQLSPPSWEAKISVSATRLRKERFVVGDDEVEAAITEEIRVQPVSAFARRRRQHARVRNDPQWTLSFECVGRTVTETSATPLPDLERLLDDAEAVLRAQQAEGAAPWRTLLDLADGELAVLEIEGSMARLERLLAVRLRGKQEDQDTMDEGQTSADLAIRQLGMQLTVSLSRTYSAMIQEWITPLSLTVPGRVRLAKEQLVRRAAAAVSIASLVISPQPTEPEMLPQTQQSQNSWDLPVRAGSSAQPLPSSSQMASQQSTLPTPSPSATPSVTTASSHPTSFAGPEISRLSRYTTFSKSTPSALPRSLKNVLSHWSIGEDPSTYDWQTATRKVAERNVEVDEQMTDKERARMQRRAERHIRRQRREAAASEAAQFASSQAPAVMSASQPQNGGRAESQRTAVGASSQSQGMGFGFGPASQVVSGRFGGRPPPKKKRKQGF